MHAQAHFDEFVNRSFKRNSQLIDSNNKFTQFQHTHTPIITNIAGT